MENDIQTIMMLLENEEYLKAEKKLEKLVVSYPDDIEISDLYAKCLFYNKKYLSSMAVCGKILDNSPSMYSTQKTLTNCYIMTSQFEKAFTILDRLKKEIPNEAGINLSLASYYSKIKEIARGEYFALLAVSAEPENFRAHRVLGLIYLQENKTKQGIDEICTAFSLKKSLLNLLYVISSIFYSFRKMIFAINCLLIVSSIGLPYPFNLIPMAISILYFLASMSLYYIDREKKRITNGITGIICFLLFTLLYHHIVFSLIKNLS